MNDLGFRVLVQVSQTFNCSHDNIKSLLPIERSASVSICMVLKLIRRGVYKQWFKWMFNEMNMSAFTKNEAVEALVGKEFIDE